MKNTIYQLSKNVLIFALLLVNLSSCQKESSEKAKLVEEQIPRTAKIALPSGKILKTRLAISAQEQEKGLSGLPKAQFQKDEAMIFLYPSSGIRQFWMPDTHFDLDIIFLDENLKVLAVEKNVPAHPGRQEPPTIYRTKPRLSFHILEIKAKSPASYEIKEGTQLKWMSGPSLSEIVSSIRLRQ